MKRLRLLKVVVQPTFVMDSGEVLEEVSPQPMTITAANWREFCQEAFTEEDLAKIAEQLKPAE